MKRIIVILQRWETTAVLMVILMLLVVAYFYAPGILWTKQITGQECVKCGASQFRSETSILGVPWIRSTNIRPTSLTALRQQYIGPCEHDWESSYLVRWVIRGAANQVKQYHSGIFPPTRSPDQLAAQILLLPDRDSRVMALEALGSRRNLLRSLAENVLYGLQIVSEEQGKDFSPAAWWQTNSQFLVICTNEVEAKRLQALAVFPKKPNPFD